MGTWITGVLLSLVGGFTAYALGRSTTTVGSAAPSSTPGSRLGWHGLALACTGAASWLLPGLVASLAPWPWLAVCYALGLSAERATTDPGPTGRPHGQHAPFRRDR